MMRLYELAMDDGASISPYVWRIRYALAHKGLAFEPRPTGLVGLRTLFDGAFKTVPILEDGDRIICDSGVIADYLDEAYPDRPMLFATAAERAMIRFIDKWVALNLMPPLAALCVPNIYSRVQPEDKTYFRESREKRLGASFETLVAGRDAHCATFREALTLLRRTLDGQPFLGGETANYADFILIGVFIWAGSVSTIAILEADDELTVWLTRCLNLYGGIGAGLALPALSVREPTGPASP
jgi:glutathione S-transferase